MVKFSAKRAVTGAHYGLKDWLVQRVTAVLMAIYLLAMLVVLWMVAPQDYDAWKNIFAIPSIRISTLVFFTALFWHAWVGVRNVTMDYLHFIAIRFTVQILVIVSLLYYLVWVAEILWG
ncbi:MAG: succinate dehydrogenase, hydrophobic membrane anchor protein [Nitrosomonas sp.]|nr:MAG: succinate dehydrogenase, hydrophobic membrane anchor protein [Nitrosomonas sp.]